MFSSYINEAKEILSSLQKARQTTLTDVDVSIEPWPKDPMQVILQNETAVELGSPGTDSISMVLLTADSSLVDDGKITLIGSDLPACRGDSIAFGKLLFVAGHGFSEDNWHKRYEEASLSRLSLDLAGCSPRSFPQAMREWMRVSQKGIDAGFTFDVLAREQYRALHEMEFVDAVEIVFITSGSADVVRFKDIAERAAKAERAMNKMAEQLVYNCGECEFQDVCDEVDELRKMHEKQQD